MDWVNNFGLLSSQIVTRDHKIFQEQAIEYFSGILREINIVICLVHFFSFYRGFSFVVECGTIFYFNK